jgi:FtsH-binding integral membrane protein
MDKSMNNKDLKDTVLSKVSEESSKIIGADYFKFNLGQEFEKVNKRVEGQGDKITEVISHTIDKHNLTLESLTLIYLALQLIPSLITMVLSSIVGISFLISLMLLIAVVIEFVFYIVILKFEDKLKDSSGSLVVAGLISICEGIILASIGSSFDSTAFAAEIAILITGLLVSGIFANTLGKKYDPSSGKRISFIVAFSMFILFTIFIPSELIIFVYPI